MNASSEMFFNKNNLEMANTITPYLSTVIVRMVTYRDLFPERRFYKIKHLLEGLGRLELLHLVSNMYDKLSNKPFFDPQYAGDDAHIDVIRFCLSNQNYQYIKEVLARYRFFKITQNGVISYFCGISNVGVVYLLREIMSMPESNVEKSSKIMEKNAFRALLQTNFYNYEHGFLSDKYYKNKELSCGLLMISRFRQFEIEDVQKDTIRREYVRQAVKCMSFFEFAAKDEMFSKLMPTFLRDYRITKWEEYPLAFLSVVALTVFKEGVVNFDNLKTTSQECCRKVIDRASVAYDKVIPKKENLDYKAFRERPMIKLNDKEYFISNVGFVIGKIYDSLYFQFLEYYLNEGGKGKKFLQHFTTAFSEGELLSQTLMKICGNKYDVTLDDPACSKINSKVSSPPDFYIRLGSVVILFELKDIKMRAWTREYGSVEDYASFFYEHLVYDGKRKVGVGQLLRQINRIKTNDFVWDKKCPPASRIYPVIVLADYRQTASGLKNLLDIWMREEAAKEQVSLDNVGPVILMDLATLMVYAENFRRDGFVTYFDDYYARSEFKVNGITGKDVLTNATMSFSDYINHQQCYGMMKWADEFEECIKKTGFQ